MRVLVLGHGSIGRRHAANAARLGHEVLAYDVNETKGSSSVAVTTSEDVAWAHIPEAVVVATPASEHAVGMKLAAAHRSVARIMVEKPVGLSIEDLGSPETAGRIWRVGYNLRYHDGLRLLRRAIKKENSPPVSAYVSLRCNMASWPGKHYTDMLLEGSHEIDVARWLFGPCRVVGASGFGDTWTAILQHASGCVTTVSLGGAHTTRTAFDRSVSVAFPGFALQHSITTQNSWSLDLGVARVDSGMCQFDEMYLAEMADFLADVPGPLGADLSDGMAVLALCDEIRRQAAASSGGEWR